jgi:hypothetical protein
LKKSSGFSQLDSISYFQGVAETAIIFVNFVSNSSNLSGLLSIALGNLKPFSTRLVFLALSQAYIQPI